MQHVIPTEYIMWHNWSTKTFQTVVKILQLSLKTLC